MRDRANVSYTQSRENSLTKLMVSHDLPCSTLTNQIAFESQIRVRDGLSLPGAGFQTGSITQKKCFWKISKHFLLSRHKFILCLQHMLLVGANEESLYLGNTEETLTSNVYRLFPRLRTQATYFENAEFVS